MAFSPTTLSMPWRRLPADAREFGSTQGENSHRNLPDAKAFHYGSTLSLATSSDGAVASPNSTSHVALAQSLVHGYRGSTPSAMIHALPDSENDGKQGTHLVP